MDGVVGHLTIDPYVPFSYYALYLQLTLLVSIGCRRCPLTKSSRCVASLLCQWPLTFIIVAPNSCLLPLSSLWRVQHQDCCHTAWLTRHHVRVHQLLSSPWKTQTHLLDPSIHIAQGVSRPVGRKSTQWLSTFARVQLRLPPSSRITSWCRRRGGRADAFPVQSPARDGRLGLCGVGVSHYKAEPPIGEFLAYPLVFDR